MYPPPQRRRRRGNEAPLPPRYQGLQYDDESDGPRWDRGSHRRCPPERAPSPTRRARNTNAETETGRGGRGRTRGPQEQVPCGRGRAPAYRPSTSRAARRGHDARPPWWQNPLLRACVVTALSAGLTAALDSRGDPGRWKGAKGAKVAVAAVGSGVVDGFLGQRHPDGLRHTVMKKGVEMAMEEVEKKKQPR
ncbi:hypothetical protein E4U53_001806 [Claviceps sorghi]|nr:hypothetical protein E4U53_001806 [Claviceps sorghi]